MSNELEVRWWWPTPRPPADRLVELARALQTAVPEVTWLETVVETRFPREKLSVITGAPDADQVAAVLKTSQAVKIVRATFSFPCWRFRGSQVEWAGVVGGIEVWEAEAYTKLGQVREIEGDGKLYLSSGGPFTALGGEDVNSAEQTAINAKVEENVQSLLEVMAGIFSDTSAAKAALYDDVGWLIPVNAHAVFYSDNQQVLQDARLLATVWQAGIGIYPPLQDLGNDVYEALHPWRTEAQRQHLFEAWRQHHNQPGRDEAGVQQVLSSGRHDVLETEGGFGVLDFPLFMNGFVDPFFLELMGPELADQVVA